MSDLGLIDPVAYTWSNRIPQSVIGPGAFYFPAPRLGFGETTPYVHVSMRQLSGKYCTLISNSWLNDQELETLFRMALKSHLPHQSLTSPTCPGKHLLSQSKSEENSTSSNSLCSTDSTGNSYAYPTNPLFHHIDFPGGNYRLINK